MNRALLVGINKYPSKPLSGCVNDALDVAAYLESHGGFAEDDIDMLLDGRATKRAIVRALHELITGARPGDRLLFHYSGHGTQMPTSASDEPDGRDEVLCPVDFDWSDATAFKDDDLSVLLRMLPAGVSMTCVLDACHTGDFDRDLLRARVQVLGSRFLAPPPDIARTLRRRTGSVRPLRGDGAPHAVILAACRSTELAADAVFDDRPNGAFTYHLLQVLRRTGGEAAAVRRLVAFVGELLGDYDMHPQATGPADALAAGFLHAMADAGGAASLHDFISQVQRIEREYRPRLQGRGALPEEVERLLEQMRTLDARQPRVIDASAPPTGISCRSYPWGLQVEIPHTELGGTFTASPNGRRE